MTSAKTVSSASSAPLSGSIVALVSPMRGGDCAVDFGAMRELAEWHLECGTGALSPAGTTGESPTLTIAENKRVVAEVVRIAAGRAPVVAGVGANSTAEALELARQAGDDGADFGLSVVPYYNRPPQEGMYRHFAAIADAASLPLILYDVPKRCGAGLEDETVARLSRHSNIVGIKDAVGRPERARTLRQLCGPDFALLSGDDSTSLDYLLSGGDGVVSVTANVAPRSFSRMCAAAAEGDEGGAREVEGRLRAFNQAQGAESNPIPTKWALHRAGKIPNGIRLPLTWLAEQFHEQVAEAARATGELNI